MTTEVYTHRHCVCLPTCGRTDTLFLVQWVKPQVSSFHKASKTVGKRNVDREPQLGSPSLHPLPHPWWTQPALDFCIVHHWPSRLAQLFPVPERLSLRGQELSGTWQGCICHPVLPYCLHWTFCQVPTTLWGKGAGCHLEQPSSSTPRSPRQDYRPETTRPSLCPSVCVPGGAQGVNWRENPLWQHPEKEVAP